MVTAVKANLSHLEDIAPLFDAYRGFYGQPSKPAEAKSFLTNRIRKDESVIFIAYSGQTPAGFVQLYTTFSSVTLEPFYILNDLYVTSDMRGKGIGTILLEKTKEQCLKMNYKGLALETAIDNPAQKLYEKSGWKSDNEFLHYFWKAKKSSWYRTFIEL